VHLHSLLITVSRECRGGSSLAGTAAPRFARRRSQYEAWSVLADDVAKGREGSGGRLGASIEVHRSYNHPACGRFVCHWLPSVARISTPAENMTISRTDPFRAISGSSIDHIPSRPRPALAAPPYAPELRTACGRVFLDAVLPTNGRSYELTSFSYAESHSSLAFAFERSAFAVASSLFMRSHSENTAWCRETLARCIS
jgi:hypothetical protein